MCAVFRDEGPYLQEWIEFHIAQGVSKFFLFNDNSSDDFMDVISLYLQSGVVHLENSVEGDQVKTYTRALELSRGEVRWLAVLDLDEFLYARDGSIVDVLPKNPLVSGCFVYWKMFGTNGRSTPSPVGVVEGYTSCLPLPKNAKDVARIREVRKRLRGRKKISGSPFKGKTIIKPARVTEMGPHFPIIYWGLMVDEAGRWLFSSPTHRIGRRRFGKLFLPTEKKLVVNHYWSKSESELVAKATRKRISEVRRGPLNKVSAKQQVLYGRWLNQKQDLAAVNKLRPFSGL